MNELITMMENEGQNSNIWQDSWDRLTPESEIRMWDYYGGRQWILKYVPRFGKTIEAGCGLGRYVFLLSKFGIDIDGVDFSKHTIFRLNDWRKKKNFSNKFIVGDVNKLPYEDNSLSGYLSFGVVEHFIEGPCLPLKEAYRVLRPGGIAIISTPSVSFYIFIQKFKKRIKDIIKKFIRYKQNPESFFQYWYRPKKLKTFVEDSGLKVTIFSGIDLLYVFNEMGGFTGDNLKKGSFSYMVSNIFEKTFLSIFGAQSVTISIKLGKMMHCFLCGEKKSDLSSLDKYNVPICKNCEQNILANFYKKNKKPFYASSYTINPPIKPQTKEICEFCRKEYITDSIFEDFGFSKKACKDCLKIPKLNIVLSNIHVKPIWRKRGIGK